MYCMYKYMYTCKHYLSICLLVSLIGVVCTLLRNIEHRTWNIKHITLNIDYYFMIHYTYAVQYIMFVLGVWGLVWLPLSSRFSATVGRQGYLGP